MGGPLRVHMEERLRTGGKGGIAECAGPARKSAMFCIIRVQQDHRLLSRNYVPRTERGTHVPSYESSWQT